MLLHHGVEWLSHKPIWLLSYFEKKSIAQEAYFNYTRIKFTWKDETLTTLHRTLLLWKSVVDSTKEWKRADKVFGQIIFYEHWHNT